MYNQLRPPGGSECQNYRFHWLYFNFHCPDLDFKPNQSCSFVYLHFTGVVQTQCYLPDKMYFFKVRHIKKTYVPTIYVMYSNSTHVVFYGLIPGYSYCSFEDLFQQVHKTGEKVVFDGLIPGYSYCRFEDLFRQVRKTRENVVSHGLLYGYSYCRFENLLP